MDLTNVHEGTAESRASKSESAEVSVPDTARPAAGVIKASTPASAKLFMGTSLAVRRILSTGSEAGIHQRNICSRLQCGQRRRHRRLFCRG